jgi:transcriptional regulator with XRE-family HTH domain
MAARHSADVPASMQKQLGQFLRKKRGDMSYPAFARKLGVSSSSLHRMEMGEQNVTLKTLEHILKRFNCDISDVFDGRNRKN